MNTYVPIFRGLQTCKGEYTKHCTRSRHQLKMAAPAEVSKRRSNFRIRQFKEKRHYNIAANLTFNTTVSFVILLIVRTARIACADRHTHKTTTVTLSAHARRGLIIHSTLAECFGTKRTPCIPSKRTSPHNGEVKRPRKQKIQAQRLLHLAQRERKSKDELTHLGLLSHKAVRAFNKALRRKKKSLDDSHAARVRKKCSHSFWKFASRVLDEDGSGPPVSCFLYCIS